MSNNSKLGQLHKKPIAKLLSRLGASSAPAFVVASIAMGGLSHYANAAENDPKSVESLQEENAKLTRELNELKQRYNLPVTASSNQAEPATVTPVTAVATPEQSARDNAAALGVVLVTSRNREEIAQDVPIPISVIGAPKLDRERIFTVDDLTRVAPGLTATTPNARRSGISIRGIGKSTGDESLEAAVGVIVDDVFLSLPGMTYQDFTDLDRVEILRGPQGTLKGKNTTLGAINYVTKEPTFTRQAYLETEVGANQNGSDFPGALRARGSISDALVDDVIAYRASFFVDRQEGDIENINDSREGSIANQRFHERNRFGGKVQFLITPTENFKAKISLDYSESKEYSNTKPFQYDPATFADGSSRGTTYSTRLARDYFGGYRPIIGSKDKIDIGQADPLLTKNYGISAKLDWTIGSHTLTSITAYRGYDFDAVNDSEQTRFDIAQSGTLVDHKQYSQELRLTSDIGELLDYQVGLFYLHSETSQTNRSAYGSDAGAFYATDTQYASLNADAIGRSLLSQSLNGLRINTRFKPETDSYAAFGQINWHLTEKATVTTGLRKTYEYKNNSAERWVTGNAGGFTGGSGTQAADANAIRNTIIGRNGNAVYSEREADELRDNSISWLVSPSYKVDDDLMYYASAAGGEKSAAISFNSGTGNVVNIDPEKSVSYELGFKGLFLDRRLQFNANIYRSIVKGYQATTNVIDPTQATGFRSQLGNIPEITATGIELEGGYLFSDRLSFTFGAAYNRAKYADWGNATCPAEIIATSCDNTGKQIVGAPKLTGIIGAHYIQPIWGGLKAQAFFSTVIRSKQNVENLLSEFGEQSGYSVTDAGFGIIGGQKDNWEFNVVGKNIFDKVYTTSVNTYDTNSPVGYDGLGQRRYIGVVLRNRF
ncbi:TonB-dependent receptor [Methylobacillus arboreus]|uniref:TonB-dependent receptor n=1 Tax=Methylobacillus arboreus TaxID=755170 RepID=UPI001E3732C6|nr:TonB-dependent receptor [Methylobacillus arboreus]MCB5190126.1 TonB-dependent receptor [Methylobacillus arboreus]